MADEHNPDQLSFEDPTPEEQDAEEARRLKEAVARLGASLREESERLHQDEAADLPIAGAPRQRPDPRLDELTAQVATIVDLQSKAVDRAEAHARRADTE